MFVEAEDEENMVDKEQLSEKTGVEVKKNDVKGKENQEKGKKIMVQNKEMEDQEKEKISARHGGCGAGASGSRGARQLQAHCHWPRRSKPCFEGSETPHAQEG